jgi:hypothetical protein
MSGKLTRDGRQRFFVEHRFGDVAIAPSVSNEQQQFSCRRPHRGNVVADEVAV